MKGTRSALVLWIAAGLSLSFSDHAICAADEQNGAQLAATCAACHRPDGQGKGLPTIVGMNAKELARKMQAFKSDEASSHIMHAVGLSLSDDEIKAVAIFLAASRRNSPQP